MSLVGILRKHLVVLTYAVGVLLLAVSGWLWWAKLSVEPARVFYGMLDQSLATNGVTAETSQDNGQVVATQAVHVQTAPVHRAHSVATLKEGNTTVKTEMVGTPNADYMRYTDIATDQKTEDGKKIDFSKVVNVWTKSDDAQGSQQAGGHQLYAQAVLGVGLPMGSVPVPIGNLPAEKRQELVSFIKKENLYGLQLGKVRKSRVNGRITYTYPVKVQTILYVRMMKTFAADVGLKELDKIEPNDYTGSQPMELQLTVDARSRHLTMVKPASGGMTQKYSGYDIPVNVDIPSKTITTAELQQLFTKPGS